MSYEILTQPSNTVMKVIDATSYTVVEVELKALRAAGFRVIARKKKTEQAPLFELPAVKPVIESTYPVYRINVGPSVFYTDAWTSGNPGLGGFRVMRSDTKEIVAESKSTKKHSNNFFELHGVWNAVKHIESFDIHDGIVYTDSRTVLSWINKDPKNDVPERDWIMSLLSDIRGIKDAMAIQILKWDTENWGEIPADYGRK